MTTTVYVPLREEWRRARAQRRPRRRTPLLVRAVRWAGRTLPTWRKARTAVMQWSAFGAGTTALWGWDWKAGLAGVFVSLLVLEWIGGSER